MNKFIAFFTIIRPINVFMTFVVYLVSTIICSDLYNFTGNILWAGIAAMIVISSGNIINDYFDLEIDRINRPKRPLPSKLITKNEALIFYLILIIASLIISYSISIDVFFTVLITNILLFLYSAYLKRVLFIGNIVVSFCTALVFIYGGIVVGNISDAIIPAAFAFLINLIREILKDIEDIQGDKNSGIVTSPIKFGTSHSRTYILGLSLLLIVTTLIPFILQIYKIEYFLIVLFFVNFPLIYFLRELYSIKFMSKLPELSRVLKIIMVFGLIAIYVGVY